MTAAMIERTLRVAVVGTRDIDDPDWVTYQLDQMILLNEELRVAVIVTGGSRGPETVAEEWASGQNIPVVRFKPYFLVDNGAEHDPKHFFMRNKQIVDNADVIICLWDGDSTEVKDILKRTRKADKDVLVVEYR